jgi:hypothetical protein
MRTRQWLGATLTTITMALMVATAAPAAMATDPPPTGQGLVCDEASRAAFGISDADCAGGSDDSGQSSNATNQGPGTTTQAPPPSAPPQADSALADRVVGEVGRRATQPHPGSSVFYYGIHEYDPNSSLDGRTAYAVPEVVANMAGERWVGVGFRQSSAGPHILISADGNRQFRRATWKPTENRWTTNGHLNVSK